MNSQVLIWTICIGAAVLSGLLYFLYQGAPFVRTSDEDIEAMLRFITPLKNPRIVDLGSGDGKVIMEFARHGHKIDGIEVKPWLVWRTRRNIHKEKLEGLSSITWGSFWSTDVSKYNVVILYGVPHIMGRLEAKFKTELKPHSIVVSNYFSFPNLKPNQTIGRLKVYKLG
jgi:precorrin-6B methylase 2